MFKYHNISISQKAGVYEHDEIVVRDADDMLDIIAEAGMNGCNAIIMHAGSFDPQFFDLKTGVAGEILQKISNYRMKLVVTGDFSEVTSKSLRDFIRECNRGITIRFAANQDEGLEWLQVVMKK